MTKQEFLNQIADQLTGVPEDEKQKSLDYFSEMIEDRMEDGMSEEDAVAAAGSVDDAVKEILSSVPLTALIKTKARSGGKRKTWEAVLLILGSPIWVPLLLVFVILLFVLYVVIWAVVVCFWTADLALLLSGLISLVAGFASLSQFGLAYPLALIGAGFLLSGGGLMLIVPLVKLSKVCGKLAKVVVLWIKSWFVGGKKHA